MVTLWRVVKLIFTCPQHIFYSTTLALYACCISCTSWHIVQRIYHPLLFTNHTNCTHDISKYKLLYTFTNCKCIVYHFSRSFFVNYSEHLEVYKQPLLVYHCMSFGGFRQIRPREIGPLLIFCGKLGPGISGPGKLGPGKFGPWSGKLGPWGF